MQTRRSLEDLLARRSPTTTREPMILGSGERSGNSPLLQQQQQAVAAASSSRGSTPIAVLHHHSVNRSSTDNFSSSQASSISAASAGMMAMKGRSRSLQQQQQNYGGVAAAGYGTVVGGGPAGEIPGANDSGSSSGQNSSGGNISIREVDSFNNLTLLGGAVSSPTYSGGGSGTTTEAGSPHARERTGGPHRPTPVKRAANVDSEGGSVSRTRSRTEPLNERPDGLVGERTSKVRATAAKSSSSRPRGASGSGGSGGGLVVGSRSEFVSELHDVANKLDLDVNTLLGTIVRTGSTDSLASMASTSGGGGGGRAAGAGGGGATNRGSGLPSRAGSQRNLAHGGAVNRQHHERKSRSPEPSTPKAVPGAAAKMRKVNSLGDGLERLGTATSSQSTTSGIFTSFNSNDNNRGRQSKEDLSLLPGSAASSKRPLFQSGSRGSAAALANGANSGSGGYGGVAAASSGGGGGAKVGSNSTENSGSNFSSPTYSSSAASPTGQFPAPAAAGGATNSTATAGGFPQHDTPPTVPGDGGGSSSRASRRASRSASRSVKELDIVKTVREEYEATKHRPLLKAILNNRGGASRDSLEDIHAEAIAENEARARRVYYSDAEEEEESVGEDSSQEDRRTSGGYSTDNHSMVTIRRGLDSSEGLNSGGLIPSSPPSHSILAASGSKHVGHRQDNDGDEDDDDEVFSRDESSNLLLKALNNNYSEKKVPRKGGVDAGVHNNSEAKGSSVLLDLSAGDTNGADAAAIAAAVSSVTGSKVSSPTTGSQQGGGKEYPGAIGSSTFSKKKKRVGRGVSFEPEELRRVQVYEVDNSVYIRIEYSRPVIGWVFLLVSVLLSLIASSCQTYFYLLGVGPYTSGTWVALGELVLALALMIFYFPVAPVDGLMFLLTRSGLTQALGLAVLVSASTIARQASTNMTGVTRNFSLACVHPLIITAFGKVFRNTLFNEELVGTGLLFVGTTIVLFPLDLHSSKVWFAEVVNLSEGIYIASFLFLATKIRARASILLIFLITLIVQSIAQVIVASATNQAEAYSTNPTSGMGGFTSNACLGAWLIAVGCSAFSLLGYFATLKFLPPITVAVAMVVRPIIQVYIDYIFFLRPHHPLIRIPQEPGYGPHFNPDYWGDNPSSRNDPKNPSTTWGGGDGGGSGSGSGSRIHEGLVYMTKASVVFNWSTSVGSVLVLLAAGYMLYISSIKRARVEMLLKTLSKRRKPRDPFKRKGSSSSHHSSSSLHDLSSGGGLVSSKGLGMSLLNSPAGSSLSSGGSSRSVTPVSDSDRDFSPLDISAAISSSGGAGNVSGTSSGGTGGVSANVEAIQRYTGKRGSGLIAPSTGGSGSIHSLMSASRRDVHVAGGGSSPAATGHSQSAAASATAGWRPRRRPNNNENGGGGGGVEPLANNSSNSHSTPPSVPLNDSALNRHHRAYQQQQQQQQSPSSAGYHYSSRQQQHHQRSTSSLSGGSGGTGLQSQRPSDIDSTYLEEPPSIMTPGGGVNTTPATFNTINNSSFNNTSARSVENGSSQQQQQQPFLASFPASTFVGSTNSSEHQQQTLRRRSSVSIGGIDQQDEEEEPDYVRDEMTF